jgi:thymidine kinase
MAARHHDHHASVQQNRSPRLEVLINRCQRHQANNLLDDRKQQPRLEYLAVGRRSSGGYQIIVVGTRKPFVAQRFKTIHHCVEAATELEEIFDLGLLIEDCSDEAMEQVRAIVLAHAHREQVELELGQKQSSESL